MMTHEGCGLAPVACTDQEAIYDDSTGPREVEETPPYCGWSECPICLDRDLVPAGERNEAS